MRYKNVATCFFRFVTNHTFDRRMDGQTDTFLVASPCLHSIQRCKNDKRNNTMQLHELILCVHSLKKICFKAAA